MLPLLSLAATAEPTLSGSAPKEPPARRWALAIGVGAYDDRGIPTARVCVQDALDAAAALRAGGCSEVTRLTDGARDPEKKPSFANVKRAIQAFLQDGRIGSKDAVVVYFSGQAFTAGGETYLAASDTRLGQGAPASGLALSWVRDQLAGSPAAHKLLLLDAPHAPLGAKGSPADLWAPLHSGAPGPMSLVACEGGRCSLVVAPPEPVPTNPESWDAMRVRPPARNSLFTHYLLQALAGRADADGNHQVWASELAAFLQTDAPAVARTRKVAFQPVVYEGSSADFAVARVPRRSLAPWVAGAAGAIGLLSLGGGGSNPGAPTPPPSGTDPGDQTQPPSGATPPGDQTQPPSGGTSPGDQTQPPSGGTSPGDQTQPIDVAPPGDQTQPPSGGTSPGDQTQPPSETTPPADGSQPPTGGTTPGDQTQPPSGGTAPGGQTQPPSGGTSPGDQAQPPSDSTTPGDQTPPQIADAFWSDTTHLVVVFTEPVTPGTANDPANYTLSPGLAVVGAVLQTDGKTVILTTDPQAGDTPYTITIVVVTDLAGNVIAPPGNTAPISPLVAAPQVISAAAADSTHVDVLFSRAVASASAGTAENYVFGPALAASAAVIQPDGVTVRLTTGEQTAGSSYTVTVTGVEGVDGQVVAPPRNTATFTGIGVRPRVVSVTAMDTTHVMVVYSEAVAKATAEDPAHYAVSPALSILGAALLADGKSVRLTTTTQSGGVLYTLTVTGVDDLAANTIAAPDNTGTFGGVGSWISFQSNRDGQSQIYLIRPDGTGAVAITSEGKNDEASWSRDGTHVVFISNRVGNREVYVMDANGENETRLTFNSANEDYPSWSPDGTRILFESQRSGNPEVWVMDADGSNVTRVTTGGGREPVWSPDGEWILFRQNDGIYRIHPDGTGTAPLILDGTAISPAFSPDGSRIAFVSRRDGNLEIYTMAADGAGPAIRLTNDQADDESPSWSPDGLEIAFRSARSEPGIYVMNAADGSNVRRLAGSTLFDSLPSWGASTAGAMPAARASAIRSPRQGDIPIRVTSGPETATARLTALGVEADAPAGRASGLKIVPLPAAGSGRAAPAQAWEFAVQAPAGSEATLTWPDLSALGSRDGVALEDVDAKVRRSMRTTASYRFTAAEGARRFRVTQESGRRGGLALLGLNVRPLRGSSRMVSFTLSQPATVDLAVMAPTGARVATITRARASTAGINQVVWSGQVQPGVYLMRAAATADDGTSVQVTLPVVVVR